MILSIYYVSLFHRLKRRAFNHYNFVQLDIFNNFAYLPALLHPIPAPEMSIHVSLWAFQGSLTVLVPLQSRYAEEQRREIDWDTHMYVNTSCLKSTVGLAVTLWDEVWT